MDRRQVIVVSITIFLCLLFTSFGYAALNTELSISGEAYVRVDSEIRVTGLKLSSITNGGYETYNSKYSKDTASMFVNLPANGSAIYELAITNNSANDYYLKNIVSSNSNYELLDGKVYDVFSSNSTKTIRIKIKNTTSGAKNISINLEFEFAKDANPTITLADLPSWNTKGDSYAVTPTYNPGPSGGTVNCKSNINTGITNVTDLKQLTTTGTHNITCIVKSNTGKTAGVTKSTKITYDKYTIKNLIVDGSFENMNNRECFYNCPSINTVNKKFGNQSIYVYAEPGISTEKSFRAGDSISVVANHKYYLFIYQMITYYTSGNVGVLYVEGLTRGLNLWENNAGIKYGPWYKRGRVTTAFSTQISTDIRIGKAYSVSDNDWKGYLDGAGVIDLTAIFGAGLEPDEKWCNNHIGYFDGTTTIYK